MKNRDLHPRMLYPGKLSFRIKGQIKSFPEEKKKIKEFITKPLLYEMLKGLIKEKKIKTMDNKKTTNTHLSTVESKKQTKQTRRTEIESWIRRVFLMVARWEGHLGEWVKR